ncbi:hypothetical protein SAMN04487969_102480 [Paenibacillus algorifonticola]|uniref:Uncharacterized protein n=1 Tax=Paenibacillus algorifonticola TaxID=684063 RepID=A0A1I2AG95_9BACL|nr:hypothetical protein [Paenibacillus algorifonticola]SFE43034.1 hypothetical protein SAMN04487969_102480 [Paenibacillus algorifonticola]
MEFALFMIFSIIEGFGIMYLMLKIYRYDAASFYPALLVITLMSLQSYFLREELSLESIAPVVNILVFVFFMNVVIKIPLFASMIITGFGYFIFALLQGAMVNTIPYFSQDAIAANPYNGYVLQVVTAIINFSLAFLLNRLRIGFMEEISNKMRFPHEKWVVGGLIIVILLGFGMILHLRSELLNIIYYFAAALFFFIYSYVKETKGHSGNYFEEISRKH